jgi:hypothetical protein
MYALAGLMVVASLAHARVQLPYIPLSHRGKGVIDVPAEAEAGAKRESSA